MFLEGNLSIHLSNTVTLDAPPTMQMMAKDSYRENIVAVQSSIRFQIWQTEISRTTSNCIAIWIQLYEYS